MCYIILTIVNTKSSITTRNYSKCPCLAPSPATRGGKLSLAAFEPVCHAAFGFIYAWVRTHENFRRLLRATRAKLGLEGGSASSFTGDSTGRVCEQSWSWGHTGLGDTFSSHNLHRLSFSLPSHPWGRECLGRMAGLTLNLLGSNN